MKHNQNDKISRNNFFSLIIGWASVTLSFSGISVAFIRYLFPKVTYGIRYKIRIGKPLDFDIGSVTFLEEDRIFIFRNDLGFKCVSAVCTHLRCTVKINQQGTFNCPCHGSVFDANGKVIGGPAPKALEWYKLEQKRDGSLIVDKGKILDSFEIFRPKII